MMSGGRILLIDDDVLFCRLVRVMLTTAGYDVQEAADGKIGFADYSGCAGDLSRRLRLHHRLEAT